MIDKLLFFNEIRESLFKGKLSEKQVEGTEALLNECELQGVTDSRMIAYILATAYHETAKTMQPIKEYGEGKGRRYGRKIWYNGLQYSDVSHIYFGRGHTQNTWRDNYVALTKAARKQGKDWNFESKPDLLLNNEQSAWATIFAMKVGLYTGRKLSDYFNSLTNDPVRARKIINGLDCSELIAGYHNKFLSAIN